VFLDLAAQAPGRYLVLDAQRERDDLTQTILQAVGQLMDERERGQA
jgi:thymidylate kinase